MLEVQKYLATGKTYNDLRAELGIRFVCHTDVDVPLVILNYHQMDSPKSHPVVRECRGLVLNYRTHELVARAFPRFYEWGEMVHEQKLFDASDFVAHTKEDGSLVLIYFWNGRWHANTRGSFGLLAASRSEPRTWHELFCEALAIPSLDALAGRLDPRLTYVCEYCGPTTTVWRPYSRPELFLLTIFRGESELAWEDVDEHALAVHARFSRPERHHFQDLAGVQTFLAEQARHDPLFEGVVIADRKFQRWKLKTDTYLGLAGLAQILGSSQDPLSPRHLLPFVLAERGDVLIQKLPAAESAYRECAERVQAAYRELAELWGRTHALEDGRAFAAAVAGKHPLDSILFLLRKRHGTRQTPDDLRALWQASSGLVAKRLFARGRGRGTPAPPT